MKIVSGGQTGADRAGLDVARHLGIPWGGYAPRGWIAEDGKVPVHYRPRRSPHYPGFATSTLVAVEGPTAGGHAEWYRERTKLNIEAANFVLIFLMDAAFPTPGSRFTRDYCRETGTEWAFVAAAGREVPNAIRQALEMKKPKVLMVAGSRESKAPGIYAYTYVALREALK